MKNAKLILSSAAANTFEWYDYGLFVHLAPIIGEKFFPDNDPSISLLKAFLVFAVGYLMRPIGGIFFGILGDKFGRRSALSASILCMALPTTVIGLLPTYNDIGLVATSLMIIMRMLQGLSMGGALTTSVCFLIEHTDKSKRGFAGSISMSGICVGILLGSLVSFAVKQSMGQEQFIDFGWRIPFILGIFIMFVGIYIRRHMGETPVFQSLKEKHKVATSPLKDVIVNHWFDLIVSIFINSTGSVVFYLEAMYVTNYLKMNRMFSDNTIEHLVNFSYVLMAVVTIIVAIIADKVGRRRVYGVLLLLIISSIFFVMRIFESGTIEYVIGAQIFLAILAAAYIGPEPALQAEFYPVPVRNTALSLSYNLAVSIFGGTTPFALEYLLQRTGSITSCAYYVLVVSILSMISLYFYKNRARDEDYLTQE